MNNRVYFFIVLFSALLFSCSSGSDSDMNPSGGSAIEGEYQLINFNFSYTNISEVMGSEITVVIKGNSLNEVFDMEIFDSKFEISGDYDIAMTNEFTGNSERVNYSNVAINGTFSLDQDSIASSSGYYEVMDQFVADNLFTDAQKCAWKFVGNRLKLECKKLSSTSSPSASSDVELVSSMTWVKR